MQTTMISQMDERDAHLTPDRFSEVQKSPLFASIRVFLRPLVSSEEELRGKRTKKLF